MCLTGTCDMSTTRHSCIGAGSEVSPAAHKIWRSKRVVVLVRSVPIIVFPADPLSELLSVLSTPAYMKSVLGRFRSYHQLSPVRLSNPHAQNPENQQEQRQHTENDIQACPEYSWR